MTREDAMERFPPMWVVYDSPADAPGYFVVRTWWGDVYNELQGTYDTYTEAKNGVLGAGGSFCLGRMPEDNPAIREVWL